MNILEIIKKAPEDHVYYSPLIGECHVDIIKCKNYPIIATRMNNEMSVCLSENGKFIIDSEIPEGECALFPSRDNRDWKAFERELEGTKEAVQYVPVSENGVLSGYYQVVGMTEINLDHEYYKEFPYIYFQIDGEKHRVSTEEIKRLALSGTEDMKERFRIAEKRDDKYSIDIEDDAPAEMVSIPDRPMMAAVIMSGMLAGGCKDKGVALVNKAVHLADLILDETETKTKEE